MIEELIYDKIVEGIREATEHPYVKGGRPLDKKVNRAYRAGLTTSLLLVRKVLQIEDGR